MSNVVVVVPNHLPHLNFLNEWPLLKEAKLIVIQDIGDKPTIPDGFDVTIYDHKDVKKDLGKNEWIIPTQSSACRSYGYYKAWQLNPDYIMTLDNDCYPDTHDFIGEHIKALETPATLGWVQTTSMFNRGFPYNIRNGSKTYLNHGLWSNVPDLDAPTALANPGIKTYADDNSVVIPRHNFFPMCGMNLAWKPELTPAMYFGLFGPDYGFDQYDDIWAGVLVKKILDHMGWAARSGTPWVEHRKQSNVFTNLKKQAPGMAMNESFWEEVDMIKLGGETVTEAYRRLITRLPDTIPDEPDGWTKKFKEAALIWVDLFS